MSKLNYSDIIYKAFTSDAGSQAFEVIRALTTNNLAAISSNDQTSLIKQAGKIELFLQLQQLYNEGKGKK